MHQGRDQIEVDETDGQMDGMRQKANVFKVVAGDS
jgi:hypothetical protein